MGIQRARCVLRSSGRARRFFLRPLDYQTGSGSRIGSWTGGPFARTPWGCIFGERDELTDVYSALGVYDGNAYETLYKRAQLEPLNASEIPEGYEVRSLNDLSWLMDRC